MDPICGCCYNNQTKTAKGNMILTKKEEKGNNIKNSWVITNLSVYCMKNL